jgi:hypothetical protein
MGMLLFYATQVFYVQAEEGVFYHKHTEACYETVEVPCTEHSHRTETVSEMGYCPFCDKTTYMYAFVNVETCSHLEETIIAYTLGVCQECGNIVYETAHQEFAPHTKEVTNLICGKTEETAMATVSFSQSTTEPTTNPVVLSADITVLDDAFALSEVQCSFDGGESWEYNTKKAFSENGTYTVICKDQYGTSFQETFTISCIVKPAPVVTNTQEINTEKMEVVESQESLETSLEEKEKKETEITKRNSISSKKTVEDIPLREILVPSFVPKEEGISKEGIQWSAFARQKQVYENKYLSSGGNKVITDTMDKEVQMVDMETRTKEATQSQESQIIYRLSPGFVWTIYAFSGGFLLLAIVGCLWYAYHSVVILYEVEEKERFFLTVLIGTGEKERNVYLSEKIMSKIETKDILLTCFHYNKNKNMVVHSPFEKYRVKWGKEMQIHL